MSGGSKRLVGIDVLRAIAVLGVLACHIRIPGLLAVPQTGLGELVWGLAQKGSYGVVLFFAISGFVITRTVLQRDGDLKHMRVGAFYLRRIARIWPALLLSVALGTAALFSASRHSAGSVTIIFGDAPITSGFWLSLATFTFNFARCLVRLSGHDWGYHWGVLWSLSVEEQFYLLFPLLACLGHRRLFGTLATLVVIGVVSREAIRGESDLLWLYLTPTCIDALAVGVAAALLPPLRLTRDWAVRGAVLGAAVMNLAVISDFWVAAPLMIAIGAAFVMLCCENGEVFSGRIWRPIARIGRVS